jgi:hypothetical protein
MGKFACRPMAEKLVNLPVGLWRRNGGIWKLFNLEMGKLVNLDMGTSTELGLR